MKKDKRSRPLETPAAPAVEAITPAFPKWWLVVGALALAFIAFQA
jgi:hypothetical protein